MPTTNLEEPALKGITPESSSAADVSANDSEDARQTVSATPDNPIPAYSDSFKAAWTAAHKEVPQAQGAQKFLNKIGGPIAFPHPRNRQGVSSIRC